MSQLFVPGVGAVFSADIAVPEHEREMRFYSRVLSTGEQPLWREQDLLNNLGLPIIGLGQRNEEYAHFPLQWMPHIQVADVATSVQSALELGGSELMHAKGDDGKSHWAVLSDPNGAAFGLIPIVPSEMLPPASSDDVTPVGRIAWLDLTVPDASTSSDFYHQIVGWTAQNVEQQDQGEQYVDYNMLGYNGHPLAAVCHARGANTGLPPVWLLYLPVADLAESLRRVEEEGGKIIKVAQDDTGEYMYAAIQDPIGVHFALTPG